MREGEYIKRVLQCTVIFFFFSSRDVLGFVSLGLAKEAKSGSHLISIVTDCQSSAESHQSGL